MGRYGFVVKRLITTVPLLLGIVLLVFLLLKITPGDPARLAVGLRASDAEVARARKEMGLDQSAVQQYFGYLWKALHGNLGFSFKSQTPVIQMIRAQAPVTAWLIGAGVVFSLVISVPPALLAATHRDGWWDHSIRGLTVLAVGMPMFWVGVMLITLVALPTGWFPVGGFGDTLVDHLRAIVLPGLALGIAMAPPMIRGLRISVLESLDSDYVEFGRSLGIRGARLQRRFVVRNALPPMVTLLAVQSGYFIFGAVILETVFALPGLGQGMVNAAIERDVPLVQGYTLVFAVAIVFIYLIADVVNVMLDPRVAIEG